MSIDIQLHVKREEPTEADKAIELLQAHGFDLFAGAIAAQNEHGDVRVFDENVGSGVVDLAEKMGLAECIWRPDEHGIDIAGQLIEPLATGLAKLDAHQQPSTRHMKLAEVVSCYLQACREYPDARVTVWR